MKLNSLQLFPHLDFKQMSLGFSEGNVLVGKPVQLGFYVSEQMS